MPLGGSVGRTRFEITPEILEKVEYYASIGLTQAKIADCLGIHVGTWCSKKNENPEFCEAIKRGYSKGVAKVAAALIKNIDLGSVPAQIYFLKARGGDEWRDVPQDIVEKEAEERRAKMKLRKEKARSWKREKK